MYTILYNVHLLLECTLWGQFFKHLWWWCQLLLWDFLLLSIGLTCPQWGDNISTPDWRHSVVTVPHSLCDPWWSGIVCATYPIDPPLPSLFLSDIITQVILTGYFTMIMAQSLKGLDYPRMINLGRKNSCPNRNCAHRQTQPQQKALINSAHHTLVSNRRVCHFPLLFLLIKENCTTEVHVITWNGHEKSRYGLQNIGMCLCAVKNVLIKEQYAAAMPGIARGSFLSFLQYWHRGEALSCSCM